MACSILNFLKRKSLPNCVSNSSRRLLSFNRPIGSLNVSKHSLKPLVTLGIPNLLNTRSFSRLCCFKFYSCSTCSKNENFLSLGLVKRSNNYVLLGSAPQLFSRSFSISSGQWKQSKDISSNHEPEKLDQPYLIYEGMLNRQFTHVKIFSMCTTIMGLVLQPTLLSQSGEHGVGATIALMVMVGFFTYITPFLIHLLSRKYVTEIKFDPKNSKYTAVTKNFFHQTREIHFSKDDVVVPDAPGPFTTVLINLNEKGKKPKPLFFTLESFTYPDHYGMIMGYDKPLDLQLGEHDIKPSSKQNESSTGKNK